MPGTILVGVVAALIAFMLASLAVQTMAISGHLEDYHRRRNAAESVINQAIDKVLSNINYGKSKNDGEHGLLTWDFGDAHAELTFDPDVAKHYKIPVSTNNLGADVPAAGPSYEVPSDTVQLYGVGTFHGFKTTLSVLLYEPAFPWVISSSGNFRSTGPLVVGRLNPQKGLNALNPDDLLPGHMASNGPEQPSISLGPETVVTGDVQSVGGIHLEQGAQVRGEVRPGADAVVIPPIDLTSYAPEDGRSEIVTENSLDHPTMNGYFKHAGPLTVNGGLVMSEGVVYVDGDVTINGGITGRGAIIATGKTTINGGVDLSTDNRVALLSGGDVSIHGSGQSSSFRGLVYTGGDFDASDISVVGTFVGNKQGRQGSLMTLNDAKMIQEPGPITVGMPTYMFAWDFVKKMKMAQTVPLGASFSQMAFQSVDSNGNLETANVDTENEFEAGPTSYLFKMGFNKDGSMYMSVQHPIVGKGTASFPRPGGNVPHGAISAVEAPMVDFLNSRVPTKAGPPPPLTGPAASIDWNDVNQIDNLFNSGVLGEFITALPGASKNRVYQETYDMSQFLAPADKIRVLLWAEL